MVHEHVIAGVARDLHGRRKIDDFTPAVVARKPVRLVEHDLAHPVRCAGHHVNPAAVVFHPVHIIASADADSRAQESLVQFLRTLRHGVEVQVLEPAFHGAVPEGDPGRAVPHLDVFGLQDVHGGAVQPLVLQQRQHGRLEKAAVPIGMMRLEPAVVRVIVVRDDQVAWDQVQQEIAGPFDDAVIQRALQDEIAFGPELRQLIVGEVAGGWVHDVSSEVDDSLSKIEFVVFYRKRLRISRHSLPFLHERPVQFFEGLRSTV